MSSTPLPRPPRIFEVIGPTVEKICRYVRPAPPAPKFTVTAMFERSLEYERMIEKSAQLETLRVIEGEHRTKLVAALAQAAYVAERAKFRIETRQWESVDGMLDLEIENVRNAASTHDDMLSSIKGIVDEIADTQRTLDDSDLWEQEGGAA